MNRKFLSVGECMLELSPQDNELYRAGFAGDTFNTAWYMSRLADSQISTHYLTSIGDDPKSAQLANFVAASGIQLSANVIEGASIGAYLISLKDGERSFQYWRSVSAARDLARGLTKIPEVTSGDFLFFSGITTAILYPDTREHFLSLVAEARSSGVTVCFDPNLRPRLWKDVDEMRDMINRSAKHADIILPSYEDEAQYFGDNSTKATAERYHKLGAGLVVVKDGPNEIMVSEKNKDAKLYEPEQVEQVVDSTAAGDAFNAGFLSKYILGSSLEDAVIEGCRASAEVIKQRGALVEFA